MNFIFVSPNFPHTYWQFCDRLKRNGINVLGIGDAALEVLYDHCKPLRDRIDKQVEKYMEDEEE